VLEWTTIPSAPSLLHVSNFSKSQTTTTKKLYRTMSHCRLKKNKILMSLQNPLRTNNKPDSLALRKAKSYLRTLPIPFQIVLPFRAFKYDSMALNCVNKRVFTSLNCHTGRKSKEQPVTCATQRNFSAQVL
jgi:hypothetical protein